ncbi:unnamed protein product, partial [Brassica oleracea]
ASCQNWQEDHHHKPEERYDFVKIESELDSDHGIGVAY